MAYSPPVSPTDLTNEELQFLEQQNLVQKSTTVLGKRTVSAAFLSPPSTTGSVSSSSSSASVRTRNFTGTLRSFEIPTAAESVEALEFIGFTPQAANEIFQNYISRPDPNICPDSLLDYAYGHTTPLNNPRLNYLTPQQALTRIGLTTELRDALLDPTFSDLLWTESLHFWVKDTLCTNYNTLLRLQQRMKNQVRGGGRKQKRASIHGAFSTQTAEVIPPTPAIASISMTPKDYNLPAAHVAIGSEGPLLPDHLVLYKGKAVIEVRRPDWIQEDGSIEMAAMATRSGGDFNPTANAWYWTPERDVAEHYRFWAARRSPTSETWLIRIQIPKTFINSLGRAELWFSKDWKEFVWHCKNEIVPPAQYDYLWRPGHADILRGHICTGVVGSIQDIKKKDIQTHITEDNALKSKSTNRKATQVVFMNDACASRIGELIRGKIHIEINGALQNQQTPQRQK